MTKPSIEIKTAEPANATGIAHLQKTTWRDTFPNPEHKITQADVDAMTEDWDAPEAIERLRNSIAEPQTDSYRLVAKDGDKVVGHCVVVKDRDVNRFKILYVLPEYQGQGIGYALAVKSLQWLGKDKDVELEVVTYSSQAIDFYKSFGFDIVGRAQNEAATLPSGTVRPQYKMVRRKGYKN